MEDDVVWEYDSTWDTESDGDDLGTENSTRRACPDKNKKTKPGFWSNSSSRNLRAAKDMQNYRHRYPNITDEDCSEDRMPNLKFYLNEIKSSPDDVSIETFHNEWKTDYKRLERVHSYIQWLFPLREPGVNYLATELTKKEIQNLIAVPAAWRLKVHEDNNNEGSSVQQKVIPQNPSRPAQSHDPHQQRFVQSNLSSRSSEQI